MIKKILVLILVIFSSSGFARDLPPLLTVGGGLFNTRNGKVMAQAEYRWRILQSCFRPQVGIFTSEFNSFYVYLGLALDIFLRDFLVLTPSFSPGLYYRGTHGVRLGHEIEFRSAVELAYVFGGGYRLGAQIFHVSNASISNKNPGANAGALFLSIPLRCLERYCN